MDYTKIYNSLVERAKNRTITGYTEVHHIIPRCLGGGDEKENLAVLTPEEHYVAHQLLTKIYPKNHSLLCATVTMCRGYYRVNNKLYGWVRRKFSSSQSNRMVGSGNNMYNQRWVSNEFETVKVGALDAEKMVASGKYISGKKAVRADCGCLVRSKCTKHSIKRRETVERKRDEFIKVTTALFHEFLESDVQSITKFAKLKNTSQPALTQVWKKYVPEYAEFVSHGKSFKKTMGKGA